MKCRAVWVTASLFPRVPDHVELMHPCEHRVLLAPASHIMTEQLMYTCRQRDMERQGFLFLLILQQLQGVTRSTRPRPLTQVSSILHLVMQADELEGLHAEPELSVVVQRIGLNSGVHITPGQSKRTEEQVT